jgi:hypothetical protein
MITITDKEKRNQQNSTSIVMKSLSTLGKEGNFSNHIKSIYNSPIISIISLDKIMLSIKIRKKAKILPVSFNTVLEVLVAMVMRLEKETHKLERKKSVCLYL